MPDARARSHPIARWLRRAPAPAPAPITAATADSRWRQAVDTFVDAGWTQDQWTDLHALYAGSNQLGGRSVARWLRNPADKFTTPISPVMVRDLFARHGMYTDQVLAAVTAGASERFCVAFLGPQWNSSDHISAEDGWDQACALDLAEPQATGWAATDYLGAESHPPLRGLPAPTRPQLMVRIQTWVDYFGPTAYLYVLADLDLDEAVAMRDANTSPTEQQLRVMVALAGHDLPRGV